MRDFGIMFTTRMVIARLSDGALWVDSPVPASSDTLKGVTALGPVRYLVAATPRHVWRLAEWHAIPRSGVMGREAFFVHIEKRQPGVHRDSTDTTPRAWAEDFDQVAFRGNPFIEEVIFLHKKSGTVILDDLIQNHLPVKGKPLRNTLFKLVGACIPQAAFRLISGFPS